VLILDGAGWHQRSGTPRVPDNISLLCLPPYAPELNPMEKVWEYRRSNKLCGVVRNTYDAMVEACCEGRRFLTDDPDRIRSIGTRDCASVGGYGGW
jgi:transposase